MIRRRFASKPSRYNRKQMASPDHPIDAALRAFLAGFKPNEKQLAKQIGRSQSWLNKYLKGKGKATIDDVVRLLVLIVPGVAKAAQPLTAAQRKLLEDWTSLPLRARADVKRYVATMCAGQAALRIKPAARLERNNHGTSGKSPGTR